MRLTEDDVACWVLKTTRPPAAIDAGWRPGTARSLTRCVRRSYRLDLMAAGQPCLLWLSGREQPGVHALGELTGSAEPDGEGWVVPVRFTLLAEPVTRADLVVDPVVREAEVIRMPAGSNPSWLSAVHFAAVLSRAGESRLRPWTA